MGFGTIASLASSAAKGGKGGGGGGGGGGIPNFGPMLQFTHGQNMQRVRDQYAKLGLGGSTMEAQDLAGQNSASAAQGASLSQLAFQDALQQQQLDLQAQNQFFNQDQTAAGNTGFNAGAASILGTG